MRARYRVPAVFLISSALAAAVSAQTEVTWEETPTHRIKIKTVDGVEVGRWEFARPAAARAREVEAPRAATGVPGVLAEIREAGWDVTRARALVRAALGHGGGRRDIAAGALAKSLAAGRSAVYPGGGAAIPPPPAGSRAREVLALCANKQDLKGLLAGRGGGWGDLFEVASLDPSAAKAVESLMIKRYLAAWKKSTVANAYGPLRKLIGDEQEAAAGLAGPRRLAYLRAATGGLGRLDEHLKGRLPDFIYSDLRREKRKLERRR